MFTPRFILLILASVIRSYALIANNAHSIEQLTVTDTVFISNELTLPSASITKDSISTKEKRKEKWVAAITACPFPLGFVGAHRIVLGTKPWVPLVYIATFGGVLGLLPLIDFCVILFSKDIEQYENNPNIFMWMK